MLKRRALGVAALVVVAAAAGFALFRFADERSPPAPPPLPAPVIPERLPDISLADREGRLRSLSEWSHRPLVINFWATWCAPCRREIPMLNELAREHAPAGLEVIGIAIDFREDVLAYVEATPIDYTVLIGEEDGLAAARAFGMASIGLPFTVFSDASGRIATIHVGELHRPEAEVILSAVQGLDAGRIGVEAARREIRDGLSRLQAAKPGS